MPRIRWHAMHVTSSVDDPCAVAIVDRTGTFEPSAPVAGNTKAAPTAAGYRPGQRADAPTAGSGRPAPTAGKKIPPVTAGFRFPAIETPVLASRRNGLAVG